MTNALEELKQVLEDNDLKMSDIAYACIIHIKNFKDVEVILDISEGFTLKDVSNLNFKYDDGYGSQALFGFVVFKNNSWLERWEYDGSEGWTYKCKPTEEHILNFKKSYLR
jgi:hypothetical protein